MSQGPTAVVLIFLISESSPALVCLFLNYKEAAQATRYSVYLVSLTHWQHHTCVGARSLPAPGLGTWVLLSSLRRGFVCVALSSRRMLSPRGCLCPACYSHVSQPPLSSTSHLYLTPNSRVFRFPGDMLLFVSLVNCLALLGPWQLAPLSH